MTTAATALRAESTGNGVGLNHPYDWKIDAKTELLVTKITDATGAEETLVVDTDYTVTNVGVDGGGNVVIDPALPSGYSLVIIPNVDYSQTADFTNQNSIPPEEVESALDRLSIQIKAIVEQITRIVTLPIGSSLSGQIGSPITSTTQYLVADTTDGVRFATPGALSSVDTLFSGLAADDFMQYNGSAWVNKTLAQIKTALGLVKNNYSATAAPTVNDDDGDGYAIGSQWYDGTNDNMYHCLDATTGAAVWVQGDIVAADLGSAALSTLIDDDTFATATSSNIPSAESVKAYVDGQTKQATQVKQTSGQVLSATTLTTLAFDAEDFDDGGWHDNATNNSRITVDFTGRAEISANFAHQVGTSVSFRIEIYKNGTIVKAAGNAGTGGGAADIHGANIVVMDDCSSGDYYEVKAYSSVGGTLNTDYVWFSVKEL